jgi:hypothetical protein
MGHRNANLPISIAVACALPQAPGTITNEVDATVVKMAFVRRLAGR